MKETLKNMYKDGFVDHVKVFNYQKYYYFVEENNNIFGILKNNITDNEFKLITHFYDYLNEMERDENHVILDFLLGQSKELIPYQKIKYYFIRFFNIKDDDTKSEIDNLLRESLSHVTLFTKRFGVYIIISEEDVNIGFNELIQSIETDFFVKLIGYESNYLQVNSSLPTIFQMDYENFKAYKDTNQLIINKVNLLMNNIVSQLDEDIKKKIKQYILKEFVMDSEMLSIIKIYFETNFNSSLTAKLCYMHRNTLLNKLDKFMAVTHFNLRNYDEAFIVYLAIIM